MSLRDAITEEWLPPLDEVTEPNHVKRVQRWHDRLFSIIDEAEELGCRIDGESEAHAGMEAEWELMQRERQLASAVEFMRRALPFVECDKGCDCEGDVLWNEIKASGLLKPAEAAVKNGGAK